MIKRIKLIEKKAFSFTYERLVQICLVIVLLCVGLVVFKSYQVTQAKSNLKNQKNDLLVLEKKRDALMNRPIKKEVEVGEYQELFNHIDRIPKWSQLINDVSVNLPGNVWITSFKTRTSTAVVPTTKEEKKESKKKKKAESAQKNQNYGIEIAGLGSDIKNVTEFASNLSNLDTFKTLVLKESQKESFGFSFMIHSELKNAR